MTLESFRLSVEDANDLQLFSALELVIGEILRRGESPDDIQTVTSALCAQSVDPAGRLSLPAHPQERAATEGGVRQHADAASSLVRG